MNAALQPSAFSPQPYFSTPPRLAALQDAADRWLGTPFHAHGRICGPRGGCSCETLVQMLYYEAAFLPEHFRIPIGPLDWHRAAQHSIITPFVDARPEFQRVAIERAAAGDLLGFRIGEILHHLAILLAGGRFIHCLRPLGVHWSCLADATWRKRLAVVWRPVVLERGHPGRFELL